jgi:hypothetical protein
VTDNAESFGPYTFTLSPAETAAVAARSSLRAATRDALITSRFALAAFVLVLLFAPIMAKTGLISRRAGEATILLAAAAYIIQRLATHWRMIRRTRNLGPAPIVSLEADGALAARIDDGGVTLDGGGRSRRLEYVECEEVEDASGLIYLWPRDGAPIVLPARTLGDGEARRLVAQIKQRIGGTRPL